MSQREQTKREAKSHNSGKRERGKKRRIKNIKVWAALSSLTLTLLGISTCSIFSNRNGENEHRSSPDSNSTRTRRETSSDRKELPHTTQTQPLDRMLTLEDAKKFERVYTEPLSDFRIYSSPSKRCEQTLQLLELINHHFITTDNVTGIREALEKLFNLYNQKLPSKTDAKSLTELATQIRDELVQNGIVVTFALAHVEGLEHPIFLTIAGFKVQSIEHRVVTFEGKTYRIPILRVRTINGLDPMGVAKTSWAVTINGAVVFDMDNFTKTYHELAKTLDEYRLRYEDYIRGLGLDPSRKNQLVIPDSRVGKEMTRSEWYESTLGLIASKIQSLSFDQVKELVTHHELGHAIQHRNPGRVQRFLNSIGLPTDYFKARAEVAEIEARFLELALLSNNTDKIAYNTQLRLILDLTAALNAPQGYDNQHSKIAETYISNLGMSLPVVGKLADYGTNMFYVAVYLNLAFYNLNSEQAEEDLGRNWLEWQRKNLPHILDRIAK